MTLRRPLPPTFSFGQAYRPQQPTNPDGTGYPSPSTPLPSPAPVTAGTAYGQPAEPTAQRSRAPLAAIIASILVLAIGVGVWVWRAEILPGQRTPVAQSTLTVSVPAPAQATAPVVATATVTVAAPAPSTTSVTPTLPPVDPRVEAFNQLEALVVQDAATNPVRGQWVAQLASKYEGVVDTAQQAEPFTVQAILAEHMRLRNDRRFGPSVRLLHLGDWGKSATPAAPMWVTVADIDLSSASAVTTWCQAQFPQRGKALDNVCLARQLKLKGT